MKDTIIKKVSVRPLVAALNQPFKIASGAHTRLDNAFIELETASGVRGWGEAAPASHITGETAEATLSALKTIAHDLKGADCADYVKVLYSLREKYADNPCAVAGAEMAVLDALCRNVRIPFRAFFGSGREDLRIDMTVVIGSVDEAAVNAAAIYKRGIRAFKIKVGGDFDLDLNRVLAVNEVSGGCPVYLDANEGFSAEDSLGFLKTLKKHGVVPAFYEQPVPRGDWDGLKKVSRYARTIGCCVGTDETVQKLPDAVRVIKEKAACGINIKTMKFGFLGSRELARLALGAGLKLMIGGMMESALSMTASAHLASGIGGFSFIDLDTPLFVKDKIMAGSPLASDGVYKLGKIRAGIGVSPV
ncbi:MAG: dipeptide epimerase [Elusimicrobiaceae bacterium]